MSRAWFAGLLTALAVWATAPVRADDAPAGKGPYVVLVGVGQFEDKTIPPRPTAEADARALYKVFSDPQYLSTPDRVVLLTSHPDETAGEKKATKEAIVQAVHDAVANTAAGDTVVIGFFGRGAASGKSTCLFTPDTVFAERAKTGVLGSDLEKDIKAAEDRKLCILMDVDFKGVEAKGKEGKEAVKELIPGLGDFLKPMLNQDDSGESLPVKNKVLFLSNSPAATPLVKGDRGLFATLIQDALTGAADADGTAEGYEPDGLVTTDEVVAYLEREGPKQARELGQTKEEKQLVPLVIPNDKELDDFPMADFPLTKNPKATAKADERRKALRGLAANNKIPADVAAEGEKLLARMPRLKADQELRKKYQALADNALAADEFLAQRGKIKEGMKLTTADAERYAAYTMRGVMLASKEYIKPLPAGDWAAYAVKGLYWKLDEPIPAELKTRLANAKALTEDQLEALLADARKRLGKRDDLPGDKDVDITLGMMFAQAGDKYSTYYDKETVNKMASQIKAQYTGIGVHIRRALVQDGILVVSPIKGSPAYKAGMKAGDLIVEIRREVDPQGNPLPSDQPKVISTKGMKSDKAVELILGKAGVPITVVVERTTDKGEKERHTFDLVRGQVSIETVLGVKRDDKDDWDYYLDRENKVGYICITQFAPTTYQDLVKALLKLKANTPGGLSGLVLDLRFNPGGLLDQAVGVSDLFLEEGLIVSTKYRTREEERRYDRGLGTLVDFPIVVLVNDRSASAAEIVSAALQDHAKDRAGPVVLVGERTYGKGSVQVLKPFTPTGGEIKLTAGRYYPPSGRNIDKMSTGGKPDEVWGVKPDIEVKLTDEQKDALEDFFRNRELITKKDPAEKAKPPVKDDQLEKAVEVLKEKVRAQREKPGKKAG